MEYLKELEEKLKEEHVTQQYFNEVHYDKYLIGLNEYYKIQRDDETHVLKNAILEEVTKLVLFRRNTNSLRICSLGCGDGSLDKLILHEILRKYPNIAIEFVGVEINAARCSEAQKQLVFPGCSVKITMYNQDFLLNIPEESFDLVLAVHSFYYIKSSMEGITQLNKLRNEAGTIFLVMTRTGALFEPLHLFCKVRSTFVILSSSISEAFKQLNIPFTMKKEFTCDVDLTEAIENDFTSFEQQCLLSFLTGSYEDIFDDAIKRSCINYFKQVAKGKPENYLLHIDNDYFIAHGHTD